jgi:hypothetical protein
LRASGLLDVRTLKDVAGIERVVIGRQAGVG